MTRVRYESPAGDVFEVEDKDSGVAVNALVSLLREGPPGE